MAEAIVEGAGGCTGQVRLAAVAEWEPFAHSEACEWLVPNHDVDRR
jgi:hypothetical protein